MKLLWTWRRALRR